jgi:Flp pilus assembly protein TadG
MKRPFRFARGQDLLEYALVLPFFLWTIMAIFDIGRAMFFYSSLTNAVREAARFGIINYNDTTGVRDIICDRSLGLNPERINACNPALCTMSGLEIPCWSLNWGTVQTTSPQTSRLTVNAAYFFEPMTPFINLFIGPDELIFQARAIMQAEDFPP